MGGRAQRRGGQRRAEFAHAREYCGLHRAPPESHAHTSLCHLFPAATDPRPPGPAVRGRKAGAQLTQGCWRTLTPPHTPAKALQATFSGRGFPARGLWSGKQASPTSKAAFQTPRVAVLPSAEPPPRHASARSWSSPSHSPALSAGQGGNDVMLFLCQVSFQLLLSPPALRLNAPPRPLLPH